MKSDPTFLVMRLARRLLPCAGRGVAMALAILVLLGQSLPALAAGPLETESFRAEFCGHDDDRQGGGAQKVACDHCSACQISADPDPAVVAPVPALPQRAGYTRFVYSLDRPALLSGPAAFRSACRGPPNQSEDLTMTIPVSRDLCDPHRNFITPRGFPWL